MFTPSEEMAFNDDHCLHLSMNKIMFQGVGKLTNVCFDESNIQVFNILPGQDVTEVEVKSPFSAFCKRFTIEEKGRVISIKYSPNLSILTLQRTPTTIEFFTFKESRVAVEFTHSFKNFELLGYMWSSNEDLIAVTNLGIKLFKVDPNSRKVTNSNNINVNIGWYTYSSLMGLLLVKVVEVGNPVLLVQVKQSQLVKLPKFDLYGDSDYKGSVPNIDRDDVILGMIYNKPRILFVNYRGTGTNLQAEVIVRTLINSSTIKITHVLKIGSGGRFGLNIVDNLIIVHNQNTKSSLLFDITDAPFNGVVSSHKPLVDPMPLQPFPGADLYSPTWAIFQPNIIMDVKIGCLWGLELNLNGLRRHFKDKKGLIKCLLLRKNSEIIIANILLELSQDPSRIEELSEGFDNINKIYRQFLDVEMKSHCGTLASSHKQEEDPVVEIGTVVDQCFLNNLVFSKLEEIVRSKGKKESRILTWTLLEYIRSLTDFQIPAYYFIYELLINSLVKNDSYYQLHQLLQYHVIADSKPLACLLLSLENLYPAASQLAIDMLERLGTAKEEIKEILLSNQQILSCLRYMKVNPQDRLSSDKYIEAARGTSNPKLCYTVETHFNVKPHMPNGS